jgi:hypothetical protein
MGIKRDKADALFSKWIRVRDNWTCQRCLKNYEGHTQGLHCSHFQGRAKESTRFEPLNADALCYGCHQYFTSHPAEHYEWQIKRKGQDVINQLVLLSNTYKKKDRLAEALYWTQELKNQET